MRGGGKGILIQENKTGALCAAQTQAVLTEGGAMAFDGYNGSVSGECPTLGVNCGMSTGRNGVMVKDDVQR